MHPVPRLLRSSRRYRVLTALFAAFDLVAVAAAAVGWRGWIHAAAVVLESVVWVLFLYPLCLPLPSASTTTGRPRPAVSARLVLGGFLIAIGAWGFLGFVDQSLKGIYADDVLEAIVLLAWLVAMGALIIERGWKMRRSSPSQSAT